MKTCSAPISHITVRDSKMEVSLGDCPPKILILPEGASQEARICTLAHPRTLTPSRYLFDPEKGLYEFTCIAAPRSTCQSWLIGRPAEAINRKIDVTLGMASLIKEKPNSQGADAKDRPISDGYTLRSAEMLVATPIDHMFLLLPSLTQELSSISRASERLFLSVDDLFEKLSAISRHFGYVSSHEQMRLAMEQRLKAVCDTVDVGNQEMYRLNEEKLLHSLLQKAKTSVAKGLPASLEEFFIRNALETPVTALKHEDSFAFDIIKAPNVVTALESTVLGAVDSQASTASAQSTASASSAATEVTIPGERTPTEDPSELCHLLRLRTVLSYIISSYVPLNIANSLNELILSGKSQVDFKLLDERLIEIAKMRAEALASRSSADFSRKRSMNEDDDAAETRAEKRRRKEEDEKKKKAIESRGIRDLKKGDTKKISDFFGKAVAAK